MPSQVANGTYCKRTHSLTELVQKIFFYSHGNRHVPKLTLTVVLCANAKGSFLLFSSAKKLHYSWMKKARSANKATEKMTLLP